MGREDEVYPIARQALGVFKTPTPEGVRVPTSDGAEYALYSFAPNLRVINGFVQALVGLYDLGKIAGDADAPGALRRGRARRAARAADVRHRRLVAVLARLESSTSPTSPTTSSCARSCSSMCTRTDDPVYCDTELRFAQYELEQPRRRARHDDAARRHAGQGARCGCRRSRASGCSSRAAASVVSMRSRRSWSATARRTLSWPVPAQGGRLRRHGRPRSTWRVTSARPKVRSTS